jgi:hypothetical protein
MTGVMSSLLTAATILGVWTAASLLSVPVLVMFMRSRSRLNAVQGLELQRQGWVDALGPVAR